ncbi:MAG TPA: hypothetical protein VGN16_21100 [Acidobacteriaceae bacterium]
MTPWMAIGLLALMVLAAFIAFAAFKRYWKVSVRLLFVFLLGLSCMAASGGCSDIHKASVAAGSIAASLNTAAQINHDDPNILPDERKQNANYIVQATSANDKFVKVLQQIQANGGNLSASDVVQDLKDLNAQIDQLNDQGILHLKSPEAQTAFSVTMSGIKAALATLNNLANVPAKTSSTGNSHVAGAGIMLAAVTLTPAEIDVLIALAAEAAAELVPKLVALKGETDAQILDGAAADNASAIAIAEEDGADAPAGSEAPAPVEQPVGEEAEPEAGEAEGKDETQQ